MTRQEHLDWCKRRALEYVQAGDLNAAKASMLSDLTKWSGGPLYDGTALSLLAMDGQEFRHTTEQVRNWIQGFN